MARHITDMGIIAIYLTEHQRVCVCVCSFGGMTWHACLRVSTEKGAKKAIFKTIYV